MAKTKSPLSNDKSLPTKALKGGSTSAHKAAPRKSGKPGGFLATPGSIAQPKRSGKRVSPKSGSGTGARKGNSLPR